MQFELIAKTFQGLEEVLAEELTNLGADNIQLGRRMVSFTGDKALMYKANLHCRTALRILKPIYNFKAETANEVYEAIKQLSEEKGYQAIFDRASSAGIIFASPRIDVSNDVLAKLGYSK